MSKFSIKEASELTGKSIKTIYRHIENGKLSATFDENNLKVIDKAELLRVYGEFKEVNINNENNKNFLMSELENELEVEVLKEKIRSLEKTILSKEEIIEAKDKHINSINQAMLLLQNFTSQNKTKEKIEKEKKSNWKFWKK